MELSEIKAFIADNASDPEVSKFIDTLADKRVNMALAKAEQRFNATVQGKVEEGISARDAAAKALTAREDKLSELFEKNRIVGAYREIGLGLLGDLGAFADDTALESRFEEVLGTVNKARYGDGAPPAGLPIGGNRDDDEKAFRSAMGLKS